MRQPSSFPGGRKGNSLPTTAPSSSICCDPGRDLAGPTRKPNGATAKPFRFPVSRIARWSTTGGRCGRSFAPTGCVTQGGCGRRSPPPRCSYRVNVIPVCSRASRKDPTPTSELTTSGARSRTSATSRMSRSPGSSPLSSCTGARPTDMPRDRDASGRPRNARPRDASGRPLPRDATGVSPTEERTPTTPQETLAAAQRALDDGRPFTAHEYLEDRWHDAAADERDFWQGLAQLTVGLTHLQRGNSTGARELLRRGSARLASYAGTSPYDVNVDDLRRTAECMATALDNGEDVESSGLRLKPNER